MTHHVSQDEHYSELKQVCAASSYSARISRWLSIGEVADTIRGNTPNKDSIIAMRDIADPAERKAAKTALTQNHPVVLYNGLISEGSRKDDRCAMSCFLFLDKDGGELDAETCARIDAMPTTVLRYRSLSGNGTHVIVAIKPPESIEDAIDARLFSAAAEWVATNAMAGVEWDMACRNVNRLTFVSHDPQLFYRSEFERIDVPWEELKSRLVGGATGEEREHAEYRSSVVECPAVADSRIKAAIETLQSAGFPEIDEYDCYFRFAIACARSGVDIETCWDLRQRNLRHASSAGRAHLEKLWSEAGRYEGITGGTIIWWAKQKDPEAYQRKVAGNIKKKLLIADRLDAVRSGRYFHHDNITAAIELASGHGKIPVIVAPTGTGKTTAITAFARNNPDKRICVLVQYRITLDNVRAMMGGIPNVKVEYAQSLGDSGCGLPTEFRRAFDSGEFDFVFVDEIHKLLVEDFRDSNDSALSALFGDRREGTVVVGMTATPGPIVFFPEIFRVAEFPIEVRKRKLHMIWHESDPDGAFVAKCAEQMLVNRGERSSHVLAKINNVALGLDFKRRIKEMFGWKKIVVVCGEKSERLLSEDDLEVKRAIKSDAYDGSCDLILATTTLQEAISIHGGVDSVVMSNEWSETAVRQFSARERDIDAEVFLLYSKPRKDLKRRDLGWLVSKVERLKKHFLEQAAVEAGAVGADEKWGGLDSVFHETIGARRQIKWTFLFAKVDRLIQVYNRGDAQAFAERLGDQFEVEQTEIVPMTLAFDRTDLRRDKRVRIAKAALEGDAETCTALFQNDHMGIGDSILKMVAAGLDPVATVAGCESDKALSREVVRAEAIIQAAGLANFGNVSTARQIAELADRTSALQKGQEFTSEELVQVFKLMCPEMHQGSDQSWIEALVKRFVEVKRFQSGGRGARVWKYRIESTLNDWRLVARDKREARSRLADLATRSRWLGLVLMRTATSSSWWR